MQQVVLRNGAPQVVEVPAPSPQRGRVLVRTAASVISSGTERTAVVAGGGSLPMRAIRNPDLVLMTLKHAREHGVRDTVELVKGAVADDTVMGYACAGTVLDTGGIADFHVGQRVACAGAGKANHAEVVSVPGNLVAPVPDGVPLRDAAFTTLGAIAMQGVRRAEPTLGERAVVVGLGLLGLLTVQILRAAGCQVVGVEPVAERRELALALGAERVVTPDEADEFVASWSGGVGADIAIVTASTASDAVLNAAVTMVRRKGRVVPVGDIGFALDRAPLYMREADVLISTSYGPGRYDPSYEEGGVDYPISYVRWTENRNMEEFLRLLGTDQVQVSPLVGLEVQASEAVSAYAAIKSDAPPLAAVLTYAGEGPSATAETIRVGGSGAAPATDDIRVALIGPGSFVRATHLPTIKRASGVRVTFVAARTGTTATDVARSVGGADTGTDWRLVLDRDDVDLVVIGTRHDTHAEIAAAALRAGKAVFVEKPLGLTREEIDDVWAAGGENDRLAIGFNRPFAPLSERLATEIGSVSGPLQVVYRVNAPLPHDHWLNDPAVGGGRLLGEACHMFDYLNWLCGTPTRAYAAAAPAPGEVGAPESVSTTVSYADGSVGTVHYSAIGGSAMPKERVEVFRGVRSWVLDDFRSLTRFDATGQHRDEARSPDKGHSALLGNVLEACRGKRPFEPGLAAAYAAQAVALAAVESLSSGEAVGVAVAPPRG